MRATLTMTVAAATLVIAGCASPAATGDAAGHPAVTVADSGWTGWWSAITVADTSGTPTGAGDPPTLCREVTIPSDVLFASDSAEPGPGLARAVEVALEVAQQVPGPVVVEGFLDDRGPENIPLSIARARAVADALTSAQPNPLDPARIQVVGRGEADPVASNRTASGRAQNRRVEIHVGACPAAPRTENPSR